MSLFQAPATVSQAPMSHRQGIRPMSSSGVDDSAPPSTSMEDKRNTDCVYFLASPLTCKKGDNCEYRHSEAARMNPRDCWYWIYQNCLNPNCSFRHPPLEAKSASVLSVKPQPSLDSASASAAPATPTISKPNVPCFFFEQGYCAKGDKCLFIHCSSVQLNGNVQKKTPNSSNEVANDSGTGSHPSSQSKHEAGAEPDCEASVTEKDCHNFPTGATPVSAAAKRSLPNSVDRSLQVNSTWKWQRQAYDEADNRPPAQSSCKQKSDLTMKEKAEGNISAQANEREEGELSPQSEFGARSDNDNSLGVRYESCSSYNESEHRSTSSYYKQPFNKQQGKRMDDTYDCNATPGCIRRPIRPSKSRTTGWDVQTADIPRTTGWDVQRADFPSSSRIAGWDSRKMEIPISSRNTGWDVQRTDFPVNSRATGWDVRKTDLPSSSTTGWDVQKADLHSISRTTGWDVQKADFSCSGRISGWDVQKTVVDGQHNSVDLRDHLMKRRRNTNEDCRTRVSLSRSTVQNGSYDSLGHENLQSKDMYRNSIRAADKWQRGHSRSSIESHGVRVSQNSQVGTDMFPERSCLRNSSNSRKELAVQSKVEQSRDRHSYSIPSSSDLRSRLTSKSVKSHSVKDIPEFAGPKSLAQIKAERLAKASQEAGVEDLNLAESGNGRQDNSVSGNLVTSEGTEPLQKRRRKMPNDVDQELTQSEKLIEEFETKFDNVQRKDLTHVPDMNQEDKNDAELSSSEDGLRLDEDAYCDDDDDDYALDDEDEEEDSFANKLGGFASHKSS